MKALSWTLFATILTLGSAPSFADLPEGGGGMDGGGGDLFAIRLDSIEALLENAKEDLRFFVSQVKPEHLQKAEDQKRYQQLLDKGLKAAIERMQISPRAECLDSNGVAREASTDMDVVGAPICVNPTRMAKSAATEREFYVMLIHELSHQLGVHSRKEANRMGEALASTIVGSLLRSSQSRGVEMVVPTVPVTQTGSRCLNMRTVMQKWYVSQETPYWSAQVDLQVDKTPSAWFLFLLKKIGFMNGVHAPDQIARTHNRSGQDAVLSSFHQIDCDRILLILPFADKPGVQVKELKILESSPTSLAFEGFIGTEPGSGYRQIRNVIRMPEGENASVFQIEEWFELNANLHCLPVKREPKLFYNPEEYTETRETERHLVKRTQELHTGESLPRQVSVSANQLLLMSSVPAELPYGMTDCRVSTQSFDVLGKPARLE